MDEYIKLAAALESLCTACECVPIEEKELCPYRFAGCQEYANLLTLRPADVKPVVRGKWIPVTNGRGGHECDKCHGYAPSYQSGAEHLTNYCPNCGADMRVDA